VAPGLADLHCHTRYSPTVRGRDAALCSTPATSRAGRGGDRPRRAHGNPPTDWDEPGVAAVALHARFRRGMGFEWTNDHPVAQGEIRASQLLTPRAATAARTWGSRRCASQRASTRRRPRCRTTWAARRRELRVVDQ
jgi:hypothetical protein